MLTVSNTDQIQLQHLFWRLSHLAIAKESTMWVQGRSSAQTFAQQRNAAVAYSAFGRLPKVPYPAPAPFWPIEHQVCENAKQTLFHSTFEPNTEVFSKVFRFTLVKTVSTLHKGGITCNCPTASQDFCKQANAQPCKTRASQSRRKQL